MQGGAEPRWGHMLRQSHEGWLLRADVVCKVTLERGPVRPAVDVVPGRVPVAGRLLCGGQTCPGPQWGPALLRGRAFAGSWRGWGTTVEAGPGAHRTAAGRAACPGQRVEGAAEKRPSAEKGRGVLGSTAGLAGWEQTRGSSGSDGVADGPGGRREGRGSHAGREAAGPGRPGELRPTEPVSPQPCGR